MRSCGEGGKLPHNANRGDFSRWYLLPTGFGRVLRGVVNERYGMRHCWRLAERRESSSATSRLARLEVPKLEGAPRGGNGCVTALNGTPGCARVGWNPRREACGEQERRGGALATTRRHLRRWCGLLWPHRLPQPMRCLKHDSRGLRASVWAVKQPSVGRCAAGGLVGCSGSATSATLAGVPVAGSRIGLAQRKG
jgi:hypothetical protein